MSASALERAVSGHPFFKGLEPRYRQLIAECASPVSFEAGRYVFREGDESNHFYAMTQGVVSVEIVIPGEGAIPIQRVRAGEVLGWSWLVPPHKKRFDARVLEPTEALAFDARCLRTKCREDLALSHELLKRTVEVLGQRLQAARLHLLDVYDVPR